LVLKQLQENIPLTAGSGFRSLLPLGGCGVGQYQEVRNWFDKPVDKRALNRQLKDGAGMLSPDGLAQKLGLQDTQGKWTATLTCSLCHGIVEHFSSYLHPAV